MTAFRYDAFPAFPPIKHEKREKQRAVFLMWVTVFVKDPKDSGRIEDLRETVRNEPGVPSSND